jgi:hypothetical protein
MADPVCQRCGRCCHYIKDGRLKACKHLIRLPSGRTLCRVFAKRLTEVIDTIGEKQVRCVMRKDSHFDYENCPFNTDKPRFEEEVKHGTHSIG